MYVFRPTSHGCPWLFRVVGRAGMLLRLPILLIAAYAPAPMSMLRGSAEDCTGAVSDALPSYCARTATSEPWFEVLPEDTMPVKLWNPDDGWPSAAGELVTDRGGEDCRCPLRERFNPPPPRRCRLFGAILGRQSAVKIVSRIQHIADAGLFVWERKTTSCVALEKR